ncbi:MAG: hypothetical protein AB1801_02160 [Chloroflexota bacterium]
MSAFIQRINLIRYLVVWRVNRALVRRPRYLPAEISLVLGTIIANRLPTQAARPWHKALAPWETHQTETALSKTKKGPLPPIPDAAWPIETVLFAYPGKQNYGPGELILWELKFLGEAANHGYFLETLLPAMEEAGSTSDPQWYRPHSLWGRFDIQAVYAARGSRWEPLVRDGRLDLSYRASPTQWAEGLTFGANPEHIYKHLTWLTPFDLTPQPAETGPLPFPSTAADALKPPPRPKSRSKRAPTLQSILEACLARMAVLLPGKHNTPGHVWQALSPEEQAALQQAIEQVYHLPVRRQEIKPVPSDWPGRWIGSQTLPAIPPAILPYLELASILHLGRQTHFGCGTFMVS